MFLWVLMTLEISLDVKALGSLTEEVITIEFLLLTMIGLSLEVLDMVLKEIKEKRWRKWS